MDVQRDPAILKQKRVLRAMLAVAGVVVIGVGSVAVSRLKPAAPTVASDEVYFGVVKRGPMVREVRGGGTLVPEEIRWITTAATGRVEKVLLQPGARVEPGTVILELSNPDLKQQVSDAESTMNAAVAQLDCARSNLKTSILSARISAADAEGAYDLALSELEANRQLAARGLVPDIQIRQKQAALSQAMRRRDLTRMQLATSIETEKSQLAPQEAAVSQARTRYDQLARQLQGLLVKADMSGLLQVVSVEIGQQVGPGTNLARVSDPTRLKAQIRVPEAQTRDLAIGQPARVDTRVGVLRGHVTRLDPASQGGTVGVDVTLEEALPPGVRPDQSVDGVIELERLENVLYVEIPTSGREDATLSLFKVQANGEAVRTPVRVGRRSVRYLEVLEGLREGDRVILSDMSAYADSDRVRLT